ncbi:MAG: hypothetical protein ACRDQ2_12275, partial [Gaiellales bacterium]
MSDTDHLMSSTSNPTPVREVLSLVLRGERDADLSPESRVDLETLAQEAQAQNVLKTLRDECAARLRQPGAPHAVEYLLAAACALNHEIERAHQTLLALGERLAAERDWEPLAAVAERALSLAETQAAARLLVRAHEGLQQDPARIEALERAWALIPDDLALALLLAERLGEANEGERRRVLLGELAPRFAEEQRTEGLEEAALEFVEHRDLEGLERLVLALPRLAEGGATRPAQQLLGIAFPELAKAGRAGAFQAALRELAAKAIQHDGVAAGEAYREHLIESLRQGQAGTLPDPKPVFDLSGIQDPTQPLLQALERFDRIAALPPGRGVHHDSFGPGRVAANDGDTVWIDFARSRGHKMPYAAA